MKLGVLIDTFFRLRSEQNIRKRGSPSLVGSRPAKSVVHGAARVQIPHPAPFPRVIITITKSPTRLN